MVRRITRCKTIPFRSDQVAILTEQNNKCLYCGHEFGTLVVRRNNDWHWLEIVWDHFIPFAFCLSNSKENWAAACHLCNWYKSDLVFKSVIEVRQYIYEKAIRYQHDPLPFWYTSEEENSLLAITDEEVVEEDDSEVIFFSPNDALSINEIMEIKKSWPVGRSFQSAEASTLVGTLSEKYRVSLRTIKRALVWEEA